MSSKVTFIIQIAVIIIFLLAWEILSYYRIIPSFIFSSPSLIVKTIVDLIRDGSLFRNIYVTVMEIIVSFSLGIVIAFIIAIILYEIPFLADVTEPFFTMLNSMPKVALGPLMIIICGANRMSIIIMAICINMIVSMLNVYNGLLNCNPSYLKVMDIFKASRWQKLRLLVIPNAKRTIISGFKIHISLTFIGVIMGEFLVSKEGLGYLIIYGSQIFKMNYVMTGIIILIILSWIMYEVIAFMCRKYEK